MADAKERQAKEVQLKQELAACVLNSSWFYCVLGVSIAIPIGVRLRSYNPLVYLGFGGTLIDLLNGYNKCEDQRRTLKEYQLAVAAQQSSEH